MEFELNASILPCEGAGGIKLGSIVSDLFLDTLNAANLIEHRSAETNMYRFDSISLFVSNRRIIQIAVYNKYIGKLDNYIHIGMPKQQVEQQYGMFKLDDEDNLVLADISGVCFEYNVNSAESEITEIFLYQCCD